ncbi:MAG: hypothetical protein Q7U73_05000 [Rubrivivax sp.]|nr:hypothetical protein [Rubrivivax sp.]
MTREWLLKGVLASARHGLPLDEALCLAGGGARTLRRRLLTRRRDAHLAEALAAVALGDEPTDWERCRRLATEIRRFKAAVWPRARKWDAPPTDWPAWKAALFRAAQTGIELPDSPDALSAAWARVRHYSRPCTPGTVLELYL